MIQPTNAQPLYPQQGGANAVSINIYNPQAYGAGQGTTTTAPYNYQNSLYAMPQASLYQQMQAPMNSMPAQYPVYPGLTQVQNYTQQPIAPSPQMMPESVMAQNTEQTPIAPQVQETEKDKIARLLAEEVERNPHLKELVKKYL